MRLWSLHPRYLDARGLVALWREALLAQEVLRGNTVGYRHHPQLERFRAHPAPLAAMSLYLQSVYTEASGRGYAFDRRKFRSTGRKAALPVSKGQLRHEWNHLRRKLRQRSPATLKKWARGALPDPHPLFRVREGPVEAWERG
jgi:Pyrimidine dimer DNA glycosylase